MWFMAAGEAYEAKIPQQVADDCTAFLVSNDSAAGGQWLLWSDMGYARNRYPACNFIAMASPIMRPNFLAFTITGCVGMIGMNEHGIAVGINNILGGDGQVGVIWNFVVRKILMQDNIEDALACITEAKLAGAHNFMIMDKQGKGYNVEAMSTRKEVTELAEGSSLVHTNHCLVDNTREVERERHEESLASSRKRLELAEEHLQKTPVTVEALMEMTRADHICVESTPPFHSETAGAAIMQPATGDFWAAWGRPVENEYEHFKI